MGGPSALLIVEDNRSDAALVVRQLRARQLPRWRRRAASIAPRGTRRRAFGGLRVVPRCCATTPCPGSAPRPSPVQASGLILPFVVVSASLADEDRPPDGARRTTTCPKHDLAPRPALARGLLQTRGRRDPPRRGQPAPARAHLRIWDGSSGACTEKIVVTNLSPATSSTATRPSGASPTVRAPRCSGSIPASSNPAATTPRLLRRHVGRTGHPRFLGRRVWNRPQRTARSTPNAWHCVRYAGRRPALALRGHVQRHQPRETGPGPARLPHPPRSP